MNIFPGWHETGKEVQLQCVKCGHLSCSRVRLAEDTDVQNVSGAASRVINVLKKICTPLNMYNQIIESTGSWRSIHGYSLYLVIFLCVILYCSRFSFKSPFMCKNWMLRNCLWLNSIWYQLTWGKQVRIKPQSGPLNDAKMNTVSIFTPSKFSF